MKHAIFVTLAVIGALGLSAVLYVVIAVCHKFLKEGVNK